LRAIVTRFAITRIVLFAVASVAVMRLPIDPIEARNFHLPPQPNAVLEAWARYDACWFVAIAQHGYRERISNGGGMRAPFFPPLPSPVAAPPRIVPYPMISAPVISN